MAVFADEICIVTGAASGLGAAVAKQLAEQGATLHLLDIDANAGEALAQELGAQFTRLDVGDYSQWQAFVGELKSSGRPKYLHLNAGIQIAPPAAELAEYQFANMQIDRYRRMMGVNVDGVVFGLHNLMPIMAEGGSIVVTSSLAGITPYDIDPLYAMSKHAVSGLVRSLARACAAQNLRINAICPGGIDTAIIPHDQRTDDAAFMTTQNVANEVLALFDTTQNGKTWAKVAQNKPAWIVRAPGDKGP